MIQTTIEFTLGGIREAIPKLPRRCVVLLLMVFPVFSAADAGNSGPYVSVSVTESSLDVDKFSQLNRVPLSSTNNEHFGDQRSTGWSFAGGYRFLRYLSVEAGYADFGTKTLSPQQPLLIFFSNSGSQTARDTDIKMKGAYWAVGGSYPIRNWEPYGKVGALRAETLVTTHKVTCLCGPGIAVPRVTEFDSSTFDTSTEVLLAIGLRYVIADDYVVALEAMHVANAGSEEVTGEGDLVSVSLAFQYRF